MTMNTLDFFTTFRLGWLNAWIPSLSIIVIQLLYMIIFREGGRRAVDISWYTPQDKRNALVCRVLQFTLPIVSLFIPLKIGTWWFFVGGLVFLLSLFVFVAAFHAYGTAPMEKTICNGIYRYSRNPMYLAFHVGMLGVCIASASLWLLLIMLPFILFTHLVVLGEERYCTQTYGKEYLVYKSQTPRYFLCTPQR